MFFTTISFLQGQVNKVKHENASNEQKTLLPSIPGDKPGETEELRRFLNKNLDMNLVANPKLKKGYVLIDCKLDASGKPYYFMEGTGENLYDYRTKIAKEFMRVLNLIPQWNPAQIYKNDSWEKMPALFSIYIRIPYNTEKSTPKSGEWDDIQFLYMMEWGEGNRKSNPVK
ncbi:MAG: hypothetical protein ACOXZH_04100 [Bacteroidales bacterium]